MKKKKKQTNKTFPAIGNVSLQTPSPRGSQQMGSEETVSASVFSCIC